MAARKRSPKEREHDLVLVAQLYFQGKYQSEIGAQLGLTQQQISYDLKALQKRWVKESLQHITQGKARELAKIDHLEREYWLAWNRSIGEKKSTSTKEVGEGKEVTKKIEAMIGDPAYLHGVQWCINKRCEILGFEAATRHLNIDMSKLNDGQLERLANGEDIFSVIADPGTG